MKISVIVPSYKPGEYIYECLDSLCCQTFDPKEYEVVLILNGCDQPYTNQIREYICRHQDRLILLMQTDTPGVSNARNIGIEEAHGKFLVFVDDDDIVSPTYLDDLLKVSSEISIGCANSYAFSNCIDKTTCNFVSRGYRICEGKDYSLYNYRYFLSSPWAKMIHKSIIADSRFPTDMKKSEDSVFCLQITPRIKHMRLASPDAIYYQRLREGSAMRKKETVWSIIKEHLFIEYKYLSVWIKNPFRYNLKFFFSRVVACGRNCMVYIKMQTK